MSKTIDEVYEINSNGYTDRPKEIYENCEIFAYSTGYRRNLRNLWKGLQGRPQLNLR